MTTKPLTSSGAAPTSTSGAAVGLLDFNNMTEDNVMAIADKADELIQIIKNIKATVKGGEG